MRIQGIRQENKLFFSFGTRNFKLKRVLAVELARRLFVCDLHWGTTLKSVPQPP